MIAAATAIVDLLTKRAALEVFSPDTRHPVIPGWLNLVVVHNRHGAMGLFGDRPAYLIFLAVIVLLTLALLLRDLVRRSTIAQGGFALIAGGALGNVIDRFVHGYVVDFIAPRGFYIFNVGDAAITIGAALLVLSAFAPGNVRSTT